MWQPFVIYSETKKRIYHTIRGSRRAKSSKNGFSLNKSLSSCDKYVFWDKNKQQMVTPTNSYYLISILPAYYLSRDQETYLSCEAWKMPSLYPTSTIFVWTRSSFFSAHYSIVQTSPIR